MFGYEINDGGVTITGIKDKSVISVIIPESIDGYPVTNIGDLAFYQYSCVKDIIIPNSVTNIDNNAFCYCTSLKEIIIPNSVTNIGNYVFTGCNSLKEINNLKLNDDVNLINNRFIYYKQRIYKIKHQIGNDYSCNTDRYLIDNILYYKNFTS